MPLCPIYYIVKNLGFVTLETMNIRQAKISDADEGLERLREVLETGGL
jgi:hypothetical protein